MPAMPAENPRLPFESEARLDPSRVPAHAGVPWVSELVRRVGAAQVVHDQVRVKQRQRGLTSAQWVETRIALWTAGGDRGQDLEPLRADAALAALLGYERPAATTRRDFWEAFHVDNPPLFRVGATAAIPEESAPLAGVGAANQRLLAAVQQQAPQQTATLDVEATILAAQKRTATVAYEETRGDQPVLVVWAEQDLIVHDEFRDAKVPAGCGTGRLLARAVAALPAGITQLFVRGDRALDEHEGQAWCEEQGIGSALSADLSPPLRAEITRLPETAGQPDSNEADAIREGAEVPYVPDDQDDRKDRPCVRRYLAIRVRTRQGELFADGNTVKHFAIATSRAGDGLTLLRWHREKAGTVDHAPHGLKNE